MGFDSDKQTDPTRIGWDGADRPFVNARFYPDADARRARLASMTPEQHEADLLEIERLITPKRPKYKRIESQTDD